MSKPETSPFASAELRRRAESVLASEDKGDLLGSSAYHLTLSGSAAERELQVRLVEVALLKEDLRRSQADLEESAHRIKVLYDSAPVGFIGLGPDGSIRSVNLVGANMLGAPVSSLVGRRLGQVISGRSLAAFSSFLQTVFRSGNKETCVLRLRELEHGEGPWVQIEASASEDGSECRAAMIDVTVRQKIAETQEFLLQCGWSAVEQEFFPALAGHLASSLRMDYVCIDRLVGDNLSAETVAVWQDGQQQSNETYTLADTPCGDVVGKVICAFERDVCQRFPRDRALVDIGAEGYIGTTLWGAQGQPIGLIALISRRPLVDTSLAETILKLVSVRAAGELERKLAEEQLSDKLKELNRWYSLTLGREQRVLELKTEVNALLRAAGKPPKYVSAEQSSEFSAPESTGENTP